MTSRIIHGDCVEAMAAMPEASVDAVVTDPPYGIGFMGKVWDGQAIAEAAQADRDRRKDLGPPSVAREEARTVKGRSSSAFGNEAIIAGPVRGGHDFQQWCEAWAREAWRVLKPGGHLLAFGGTRTYHRLACAVEDAGFEIRDTISWLYASGFPKSHNLHGDWEGWGTALKPAHEPIVVARKPLSGTVSANVLEHGCGALNVDGCRVETGDDLNGGAYSGGARKRADGWVAQRVGDENAMRNGTAGAYEQPSGRWPANTVLSHSPGCEPVGTRRVKSASPAVPNPQFGSESPGVSLDFKAGVGRNGEMSAGYADADGTEEVATYRCVEDCPVRLLDEQTGTLHAGVAGSASRGFQQGAYVGGTNGADRWEPSPAGYGDSGGASRFFPTFDHRHEDAERRFLPSAPSCMLCGCESAITVGPSSSPSEPLIGSAPDSAPGHGRPRVEGSKPSSNANANIAASRSNTMPATVLDATAPSPAQTTPVAQIALAAMSAESLCASCAIAIAQSAVATLRASGRVSQVGPGSTPDLRPPIQSPDPAPIAAPPDSIDTTSNTNGPKTSCGFVPDAMPLGTPTSATGDVPGPNGWLYQSKASSAERNAGLDGFEERGTTADGYGSIQTPKLDRAAPRENWTPHPVRNTHPTVKSLSLMRWLVRLVTPPGGTVLDPFVGSGSTGCAAALEGFDFIGIEREAEYVQIAEARIAWWSEHPDGMTLVKRLEAEQARAAVAAAGQGSLFDVGA